MDIFFNLKMKFQKLFRGYSDIELWNLDSTIVNFVLPKLKIFKEKHAHKYTPSVLYSLDYFKLSIHERKKTEKILHKKWLDIVDSMIYALTVVGDETNFVNNMNLSEEEWKKVEKGLINFGKYFRYLCI